MCRTFEPAVSFERMAKSTGFSLHCPPFVRLKSGCLFSVYDEFSLIGGMSE